LWTVWHFVDCMAFWIKSRKEQHLCVNLKDRKKYYQLRRRRENDVEQHHTAICEQDLRRAAVRLFETVIIVQKPSIVILPPSSKTSTWTVLKYVSMEISLDQQYENSYHISSRKYNQNWRYSHQADIYSRWLFFGFF
jgi:hypothetical protein